MIHPKDPVIQTCKALAGKVHHLTATDIVNVAVMADIVARVHEASAFVAVAVGAGYLVLAVVFRDRTS